MEPVDEKMLESDSEIKDVRQQGHVDKKACSAAVKVASLFPKGEHGAVSVCLVKSLSVGVKTSNAPPPSEPSSLSSVREESFLLHIGGLAPKR